LISLNLEASWILTAPAVLRSSGGWLVFERAFKLLASDLDNEYMMIDATIVRAHQHSAGARKKMVRKRSADRAGD